MGSSVCAVTHLRYGGWVCSTNLIVFGPTYRQQTFGIFQITADTRPFNIDVLRSLVPVLVLLGSPSPKGPISLALPSPIHGVGGSTLRPARNKKYVYDFQAKIKGTHVWRRTDKTSSQNLCILWHCLVIWIAASCWIPFTKTSWQPNATKKIYTISCQAVIEWTVTLGNESIAWFLHMLT